MRKYRLGKGAVGLGVLLAISIAAGGCGGGGIGSTVSKAGFVARMAVAKAAQAASGNPGGPADVTTVPTVPTSQPGPGPGPAPTTAPAAAKPAAAKAHAASPAPGPAPATATGGGGASTPPTTSAPVAGPAVVPRRQPSAAEVNQAIGAVHKLVPFFTPTAAQVADVGNQVCTAFDQGQSFSQVTSKALDLVGAGSYSWLIPSSVPASAVRTVVNLYCPGYAYKLV